MSEQKKFPTLAELHEDQPEVAYKQDQLLLLLSSPPAKKWVKKHPMITVKNGQGKWIPLEYLTVAVLEYLLNKVFGQWRLEVLREGQMFNACFAVVRLHYFNPATASWQFHDGVGAVGVQTDAGAAAGDLSKIKQDAVMKALPAAVSYAFKNACKKFGALFGGDLNNFDAEEYVPTFSSPQPVVEQTPAYTEQAVSNTINTAGPGEMQF